MGARRVVLSNAPALLALELIGGHQLVVPNERAARPFTGTASGKESAPSLESAAWEVLKGEGLELASAVQQFQALRAVVQREPGIVDQWGAVRTFGPAVRELLRAGLTVNPRLAEELGSSPEVSPRSKRLVRLALRYAEELALNSRVDPAELLWRASTQVAERKRLLVAGYPRLGAAELAFLDALAAPGSVLLLPVGFEASGDAATILAEKGWNVEREEVTANIIGAALATRFAAAFGSSSERNGVPGSAGEAAEEQATSGPGSEPDPSTEGRAGRAEAYALANEEEEARCVLARMKELLHAGVQQDAIALVARNEARYGPLLQAVAWEYGVPLRLSYSQPLRATRFGELIARLSAALRESLPFEGTARLLAHPLVRLLDQERWAQARAQHPAGLQQWLELLPEAQVLDWPEAASLGDYRQHLEETVASLGVSGRLTAGSAEKAAWEKLSGAFGELVDNGEEWTLGAFLTILDELLGLLAVPLEAPGAPGVELHSPLAVFGASYDHLFVLGAAEGALPAAIGDDPALDFHERAALAAQGLKLESAMGAAERESLSFWAALLTARQAVTLTYPRLADNREQVASPFFGALGLEPASPPARQAAGVGEYRIRALQREVEDGVLEHARRAWEVERRRESSAPADEYDGVVGVGLDPADHLFSASQLVTLGQCAFKWFGSYGLRLSEAEEAEEEISASKLGSLYHKALELALGAAKGEPDVRQAALDALEEAFARAEEEEGAPADRTWPLRRKGHIEKLRRVIASEDFMPAGGEVVALEARFRSEWRGLKVRGVVDRIDRTPLGLVLTDYKTGTRKPKGALDAAGKLGLDLQLPLYVEAAAPKLFPGEEVASARYYSIYGAAKLAEAEVDGQELESFVRRVRGHLEGGRFPVAPDAEHKACERCEFDLVCRRGPRLGRKAAASALEDNRG